MSIDHFFNMFYPVPLNYSLKFKTYCNGGSFQYMYQSKRYCPLWLHRVDGPAYELASGELGWMIMNDMYYKVKYYCEAAGMSGEETLMYVLKYGENLPKRVEDL